MVDLGVDPEHIYTDHGLDQALAAVRAGDTLVVTKLDRLARSVPDAREIADQLLAREVKLALGPTTHDPNDPMGKMFFNILATRAEFRVLPRSVQKCTVRDERQTRVTTRS